jgi:hypothetical protein
MSHVIRPVLQSLLIADRVYTDAATGKKIIAGTFQQLLFIRAVAFADLAKDKRVQAGGFEAGSPFLYACLTDVDGEQDFEVRYVDLADESVVFGGAFKLRSMDRLQNCEVSLPLPTLPTVKAGVFALEVLWNSQPLGSYRIKVVEGVLEGKNDDEPTAT